MKHRTARKGVLASMKVAKGLAIRGETHAVRARNFELRQMLVDELNETLNLSRRVFNTVDKVLDHVS